MVERRPRPQELQTLRLAEGVLHPVVTPTVIGGQLGNTNDRPASGIIDAIKTKFRRRKAVGPIPGGQASAQHEDIVSQHEGIDYLYNREKNPPEMLRKITPEDVQSMVDEGWFEEWDRIKGLDGDTINRSTIPAEWNYETRAKFRDEVLMPFYFPDGPIHVKAKDERGNLIREVDVNRQTYVLTWKGKLVASRSFLDNDPWASENDFNKRKLAHAQMFIVAPGKEDLGFGTGLAIKFHREVFSQGFTHIITWVNNVGVDYGIQEQFFRKLGYTEDRNRKGLITINPTTPDKIHMRKFWLTPENMNDRLAAEDGPLERWERKKTQLILAEAKRSY